MNATVRRAMAVGLVGAALAVSSGALPSAATHGGGVHPEVLARGAFTDEVDAMLRVKLDGRRTHVVHVDEPSDVVTARITVDDGAIIGWHTHPGPVIVTVASGELTYVDADDCIERVYGQGSVFVDPGQGNVHQAWASGGQTVLVATFLGVDGPLTVPTNEEACTSG